MPAPLQEMSLRVGSIGLPAETFIDLDQTPGARSLDDSILFSLLSASSDSATHQLLASHFTQMRPFGSGSCAMRRAADLPPARDKTALLPDAAGRSFPR